MQPSLRWCYSRVVACCAVRGVAVTSIERVALRLNILLLTTTAKAFDAFDEQMKDFQRYCSK